VAQPWLRFHTPLMEVADDSRSASGGRLKPRVTRGLRATGAVAPLPRRPALATIGGREVELFKTGQTVQEGQGETSAQAVRGDLVANYLSILVASLMSPLSRLLVRHLIVRL
jgi:hypothetical protein